MEALLKTLEQFLAANCDGDWEHRTAVSIVNTDNPGWLIEIDLRETTHQNLQFETISIDRKDPDDWIRVLLDDGKLVAAGGVNNLQEIANIVNEKLTGDTPLDSQ